MHTPEDKVRIHFRTTTNNTIRNCSRQYEPSASSRNDESNARRSQQDYRKQVIKGKIKSRIGQIIRTKKSIERIKKDEDWRKDTFFSVQEIIEKHNMSALRKKYMEYLERGFQEAGQVRIGGAAKLHQSPFSEKAVQGLMINGEIKKTEAQVQPERKQRQIIHSGSRPPSSYNPQNINLDNMQAFSQVRLSTCRVSPVKIERRPFTAGNQPELSPSVTKSCLPQAVKPSFAATVKHVRNLSEVDSNYILALGRKRQIINIAALRSSQKPRKSLPPRSLNDIKPWEFEQEILPLDQS